MSFQRPLVRLQLTASVSPLMVLVAQFQVLSNIKYHFGRSSNRKADRVSKDAADGKIAGGTKALDAAMAEANARTLGEFLHGRECKRVRMRPEGDGYDFYPDRRHYEEEFDAIWSAQAAHHPALLTNAARSAIHRVIFHQRPLKPQVVGKCTFAGWNGVPDDETRLPKAHPLFQQRRLYEEVNQLEIVTAGAPSRKLTMDERDTLTLKLRDKAKVSFASLAKAIKLPEGARFNKESESRKELTGDEIRAQLGDKKRFAGRWGAFSSDEQWIIIDRLLNEESTEAMLDWLAANFGLDQETAEAVANARLPDGHGRFGPTATAMLLDQLKTGQDEEGHPLTYAKAAELAGFHHSDFRDGESRDALPYYGEILAREIAPGKPEYTDADEQRFGKITNPTVHIGLNQLRKLVNAIIKQHKLLPDRIYVELARELKLNEKQKAEHNRKIKQNTDAAKARGEKLEQLGERDSGSNRMRMRIWEELNPANPLDRRCPFCGEVISIDMLMNGAAEIEHVIPYSRCLDDSAANKVMAHRHCNRDKGNLTPWEKWGSTARWEIIQDQVARLHKSKQWRFAPDAMERVERDGGFIARQLTDTQYLARIASKYLASLYPEKGERHVYAVTGRMTAMLRRVWGLNDLLPNQNVENIHSNAPKNRLDHRHHAIDAAVVGATTVSMIKEIADAAALAEQQELDRLFVDLPQPWDGFREELRERLFATTISHKADHGRKGASRPGKDVTSGRLHNDTAYGLTGRTNAKGVPIVAVRKPLLSLQPKDLTDPERMPDRDLQERLYSATQGATGKDFEKALREFAKRGGPYTGIRRVRLTEALNVIPIRDKAGNAYKGVKGDANARFDVWRMPDGKWVTKWTDREGVEQSGIISMFDAHQRGGGEPRPHPAAKRVLSLRQNDLVAVQRDGGAREIMRVVKFSSIGTMQLAAHDEAGALKGRDADPVDPFKYVNTSATGLKNLKARQIRIDELGHIHDPGPRN